MDTQVDNVARTLSDAPSPRSPFHPGEQAVQTALGVRAEAEARGQKMLTPRLVAAQREFFARLPFIVAAHVDEQGQPRAEFVMGEPGFIRPAQDDSVRIQRGGRRGAGPAAFHAAMLRVQPGSQLGLLGIDFARRRRNRINGTVQATSSTAIQLQVDQGYGNCPKYISQRQWDAELFSGEYAQDMTSEVTAAAAAIIRRADTFFIASSSGPMQSDETVQEAAWGADISHRGGEPGFLQVDGNQLSFADYPGNNLFNTLGNLQRHQKAGLLVLDFATGEVVQLVGQASLVRDAQSRSYRVVVTVTSVTHWSKRNWHDHASNGLADE